MELPKILGRRARIIRGVHVLLDADLAPFYGMTVRNLNRQMLRNRKRFAHDFAFQLDAEETRFATISRRKRGGLRHKPWAYTEAGALTLASTLRPMQAARTSANIARQLIGMRAIHPVKRRKR